ncbi:MAG: hypothetical protein U0232_29190 [Thermomicrobiales bacterium]
MSPRTMPEPGDILHRQGLIEPVFVAHRRDDLRVALFAEHRLHRIARREAEQREDDHADQQRDRDHQQDAADDVGGHGTGVASRES